MPKFSVPLHEASDALRAGDRDAAWQLLQPALNYPSGTEMTDAEFAQALGMLQIIGKDSFGADTTTALSAARAAPTDAQALYNAGYQLIESDLERVAASALARGNTIAPDIPALVNELSSALERAGMHFDAFIALRDSYTARQQNWFTRYLFVFNAIMSGHMVDARQGFSELGEAADNDSETMRGRLERFFKRHASIAPVSALDEHDLRGWHHVITGSMLTHLSPHGFDAGMNGRYAMVQDSDELIHEGVLRAVAVLQAWKVRPTRLVYSRDRSSEILAHVWHERLGIPIKAFTPEDAAAPGLFLAYDLGEAAPDFLQAFSLHRPGQLLVTHAACWTHEAPFTSDICTFHYQTNVAPWSAGRMRVNPDSQQVEYSEADPAPPADVAQRIVATTVAAELIADLDALSALAAAAGVPPTAGQRDRFFTGSPVSSSRFS